jgi:hypothetical protein
MPVAGGGPGRRWVSIRVGTNATEVNVITQAASQRRAPAPSVPIRVVATCAIVVPFAPYHVVHVVSAAPLIVVRALVVSIDTGLTAHQHRDNENDPDQIPYCSHLRRSNLNRLCLDPSLTLRKIGSATATRPLRLRGVMLALRAFVVKLQVVPFSRIRVPSRDWWPLYRLQRNQSNEPQLL